MHTVVTLVNDGGGQAHAFSPHNLGIMRLKGKLGIDTARPRNGGNGAPLVLMCASAVHVMAP